MKVGDKLMRIPVVALLDHDRQYKALPCRVVYIHPNRRFYTVEFSFAREWEHVRSFRESYFFADRLVDNIHQEWRMKNEENRNHEQQGRSR